MIIDYEKERDTMDETYEKFKEFLKTQKGNVGSMIDNAKTVCVLPSKKSEEDRKTSSLVIVLAIIGAIACVAAIAYAVYYFFIPDRLEDFDDDFDADYDDDFFNSDDEKEDSDSAEKKEDE